MSGTHRLDSSPVLTTVLLLLLTPIAGWTQDTAPAVGDGSAEQRARLRASSVSPDEIRLDGRLDEPAWREAEPATGFTQFEPRSGEAPARRTDVRVLYGPDALYIGARLEEHSDSLRAALSRRDDWGNADWFHVLIDSRHDRRTGFQFAVSPANVQTDLLRYDDSEFDRSWDAVWRSAVYVDSGGWSVEIEIPLSQLRLARSDDRSGIATRVWGINFWRWSTARSELATWAPMPADGSRVVSVFADLVGLDGLRRPLHVELQPYGLLESAHGLADTGRNALRGDLGLDLRLGLADDLTLSAAVNPDFGQVEADPAVVNLTAFESFFPEKRPLFLEGIDLFRFPMSLGTGLLRDERLFHSRRIGRSPQLASLAGLDVVDAPDRARILTAAKLAGRPRDNWRLGVFEAVTGEARGFAPAFGSDVVVEPRTSYTYLRVDRELRDGFTRVGAVGTLVRRSRDPLTRLYLHDTGATAGLHAEHRFGTDGAYRVAGYVIGSHAAGSAESIAQLQRAPTRYLQRPDIGRRAYDPTRESLGGAAADLRLEKVGGSWTGGIGAKTVTPGFEMNDIGFQRLADVALGFAYAGYQRLQPSARLQRWSVAGSHWQWYDFDGAIVRRGVRVDGTAQTRDFWSVTLSVNREGSALDMRALRGGPAVRAPARTELMLDISTDSRRNDVIGVDATLTREDQTGAISASVAPQVALQPTARLGLAFQGTVGQIENAWQYVTVLDGGPAPTWVVARMRQRTASLAVRADWALTPTLSAQLYTEPFFGAGRFTRFARVDRPRAREFETRFPPLSDDELSYDGNEYRLTASDSRGTTAFADPDFLVGELRATAVLRWQYRSGSTLFLVWNGGRGGTGPWHDPGLGDAWRHFTGASNGGVFALKLTHWLSR